MTTVLLSASAFSATESDRAKAAAQAKLAKGSLYLDAGSYTRALAEFEEAYRIFPSPKIFFNIGLANVRLAHYPEALRAFDHFVSEATDADADTVAEAKTQQQTVGAHVAVVEVVCSQAGVEIVVDDRSVGTIPLRDPLYLNPGPHRLVANIGGAAAPYVKRFVAARGRRDKLDVPIARPTPPPVLAAAAPTVSPPPLPSAPAVSAPPPAVAPSVEVSPTLVDSPSSSDSVAAPPLYRRPWFWVAAAGVVAAASVTLLLTVGRSTSYPTSSNTPVGF